MPEAGKNPIVSVIIPTYNRAHLIGRAIRSVLEQTYRDFELIVVDDASTDNTEEVVKSFNDGRLRYIRLGENTGTSSVPRNTGIKAAGGEYVALLDSDDEWFPEKLEKQINKFKSVSSDVGVISCGSVCIIEQTGEKLFDFIPVRRGDVFKYMVEETVLGDTTPLVRKECFDKVGGYDTEFSSAQSWDMWIRVSQYYKFDFVPEILHKANIHGSQNTASLERTIQGLDRIIRKYQSYLSKKTLSTRFRHLGTLCCYQGNFKKASRYFKESIRKNPRNIQVYILLLLCNLAPRLYQARLKRLRANEASRIGEILVW